MAKHYHTAVLPARVKAPRDKAKVENGVLHIQRFILARLRDCQFFSLREINKAIWELLEFFNTRPMKDYGNQTRRERFERLDKENAQQLPPQPFRITEIKDDVLVGKNYHIRFNDHFYSIPFHLVGKRVNVRRSGSLVEVFYDNQKITSHLYSTAKFRYTTKTEHMPKSHQFVKGLTPGWIIAQASKTGPNTTTFVSKIMKRAEHVQQGFNAALGVLQLAKTYDNSRMEAACERCIVFKIETYRALKSVLQNNLDKKPIESKQNKTNEVQTELFNHENIRGSFE